jgi:hypothetical protein
MKRAVLFAIPVVLIAYSVMSRTSPEVIELVAQEETAVEDSQGEEVSNEELKLYIDVYSAMQQDHSLTVDDAIQAHGVTLEEFRGIERRVQNKTRLVERVRTALVEQAKRRSAFSEPLGPPKPYNPEYEDKQKQKQKQQ